MERMASRCLRVEEGGIPVTDYRVQIEGVLKGDGTVTDGGRLTLRMFGHLSDSNAIITPNVFTLPNISDHLLFALGRNPDGTYGSGPEGLLNVDGAKVEYADGVRFAGDVSPEQLMRDIRDAASGATGQPSPGRLNDTVGASAKVLSTQNAGPSSSPD